jgi:hypothetical protein
MFHLEANLWGTPIQGYLDAGRDLLRAIVAMQDSVGTEGYERSRSMYDKQRARFERALKGVDSAMGSLDDVRLAIYHLIASDNPERDIMKDLQYVQTLVQNQQAFRRADVYIANPGVPVPQMVLTGRFQASLLEAAVNALKHGSADNLFLRVAYVGKQGISDLPKDSVSDKYLVIHIYNDGEAVNLDNLPVSGTLDHTGMHRADLRARLNGGFVRFEPVEESYRVLSGGDTSPSLGYKSLNLSTHLAFYLPV